MKLLSQQLSYQLALRKGQGALNKVTDTPALDAQVLLAFASTRSREWLLAHANECVDPITLTRYWDAIEQRQRRVPTAYIVKEKEFWSLPFRVDRCVLIPRPETELLVETALDYIRSAKVNSLLDLGTGCGCIAISIAREFPELTITAVDISTDALEIARYNASRHHARNVTYRHSDWFSKIGDQRFDLIISNPPYIAHDDPHVESATRKYEPPHALFAGHSGLAAIETILSQSISYLHADGCLILEHGWQQAGAVQNLFQQNGFRDIRSKQDLSGHLRITQGFLPGH